MNVCVFRHVRLASENELLVHMHSIVSVQIELQYTNQFLPCVLGHAPLPTRRSYEKRFRIRQPAGTVTQWKLADLHLTRITPPPSARLEDRVPAGESSCADND